MFNQNKNKNISESRRLKEIQTNIIKNHLNVIILLKMKSKKNLCGYDFVKDIHAKYNIRLSSSTVYGLLYTLERKELINGEMGSSGKRVYNLSQKGTEFVKIVQAKKVEITSFFSRIFDEPQ